MKPYLWVVEMWERGAWMPVTFASFTRDNARVELRDWRKDNPNDKFRLAKYVPEKGGRS